jgi:hypothetical protein
LTVERRPLSWRAVALTLLLCSGEARADELTVRPPIMPSSLRYFVRSPRPIEPRTGVALLAGQLWGPQVQGVDRRQAMADLLLEAGWWRLGAFLELALVLDSARTQGVYGAGEASVRGAGALRSGVDAPVHTGTRRALRWHLSVGAQDTAPTGGERRVQPQTPQLPAPVHRFGPEAWIISGGAAAALQRRRLTVQLNADLIGFARHPPPVSGERSGWLFAGVALGSGYRLCRWLTALLQLDAQLELYGQRSLRQLIFAVPTLRLRPAPRFALDVGVRAPLWRESWDAQRLFVGGALHVGLGPRGDHGW